MTLFNRTYFIIWLTSKWVYFLKTWQNIIKHNDLKCMSVWGSVSLLLHYLQIQFFFYIYFEDYKYTFNSIQKILHSPVSLQQTVEVYTQCALNFKKAKQCDWIFGSETIKVSQKAYNIHFILEAWVLPLSKRLNEIRKCWLPINKNKCEQSLSTA